MSTAKDEVRKLLDALPDDASWEDIQQSIVWARVERGRREAEQQKQADHDGSERRMKRRLDE